YQNWTMLEIENGPGARKLSDMAERIGFDEIYMFGGKLHQDDDGLVDLWMFDTLNQDWDLSHDGTQEENIAGYDGIFMLIGVVGSIGLSLLGVSHKKLAKYNEFN
ncbi:MAG: hypothetical protein ACTSRK_18570, partial [Promethearchaeota archaeon]